MFRVIENFSYKMYERPQAQRQLDRVSFAVRSMVYPLSLFELGRVDEARSSYQIIEDTIADIKDSVFAKEMYMIRDIIFGWLVMNQNRSSDLSPNPPEKHPLTKEHTSVHW